MMMITEWNTLMSSHITFFFHLRTKPIHITFEKMQWSSQFKHFKNNIMSVLLSSNFIHLNSKNWSTQLFSWRCKKWVGPLIMHDDARVLCLVIINLATVANLRSLHWSLIISLIVNWPKFVSFLYTYLLFWY